MSEKHADHCEYIWQIYGRQTDLANVHGIPPFVEKKQV